MGSGKGKRVLVKHTYFPELGDLVWATFDPQVGHEQAGRRPALVLSPRIYNQRAGLAIICPITSKIKGYPFEVPITGRRVQGAILADQARSMDWRARQFTFIESAHADVIDGVRQSLAALLKIE